MEKLSKLNLHFLSSRILFLALAFFATYFIPVREGYLGGQFDSSIPNLVSVWANFDGRHFLSIATTGYHNTNFAYFPLYPILISLLGYVLPISHVYLGIMISTISFIASLYFLKKIILLDYSLKIANLAIIICCFFPLSFFYHSVYADSLFFLLSILSFYYARKKRWIISGLFGCLVLLTRLSGIALVPALLVEWYLQNKQDHLNWRLVKKFLKNGFLGISMTSLGFVIYLLYLQLSFGDFLLFQKSFSAWGQSGIVFPPQVVFRYIKIFLSIDPQSLVYWVAVLEFVCLFAYLSLSYFVAKKIRLSYGVFMFVLLLLVPLTGTFAGTPRYLLHLFPGFLAIAVQLQNINKYKYIFVFLSIMLSLILTILFTRGYFIT